MDDIYFMKKAYKEALLAYEINDVPIGCVIVQNGGIISRGHNRRTFDKNVLLHAEMIAIDKACRAVGDWRLEDCIIYVTIEPCPMCAGAILQARIPTVVFGATNPKAGCAGSVLNLLDDGRFNHKAKIISGVYADECAALMQKFFKNFRNGLE